MKKTRTDVKNKAGDPAEKNNPSAPGDAPIADDDCRCREVSKKTFPELLKIMISDLSFRKKKR